MRKRLGFWSVVVIALVGVIAVGVGATDGTVEQAAPIEVTEDSTPPVPSIVGALDTGTAGAAGCAYPTTCNPPTSMPPPTVPGSECRLAIAGRASFQTPAPGYSITFAARDCPTINQLLAFEVGNQSNQASTTADEVTLTFQRTCPPDGQPVEAVVLLDDGALGIFEQFRVDTLDESTCPPPPPPTPNCMFSIIDVTSTSDGATVSTQFVFGVTECEQRDIEAFTGTPDNRGDNVSYQQDASLVALTLVDMCPSAAAPQPVTVEAFGGPDLESVGLATFQLAPDASACP